MPTTKFEAGRGQPTSISRCVVYNHHHETKTIVEPNSDIFSHDYFHDYIRPNRTLIVVHFAASKRSRRSLHDHDQNNNDSTKENNIKNMISEKKSDKNKNISNEDLEGSILDKIKTD